MPEDRGAHLENLACIHLRRQGLQPEYYVTRSGAEVDFVWRTDTKSPTQLLQVCWELMHLADKILTSRSALEGERKLVTVLFADVKGWRKR